MDVLLDLFRFRKSPRIRATSSRRAPLTFGVLRPVILLPEGLAAESVPFRLVLAHELAHVKRRDCVKAPVYGMPVPLLVEPARLVHGHIGGA